MLLFVILWHEYNNCVFLTKVKYCMMSPLVPCGELNKAVTILWFSVCASVRLCVQIWLVWAVTLLSHILTLPYTKDNVNEAKCRTQEWFRYSKMGSNLKDQKSNLLKIFIVQISPNILWIVNNLAKMLTLMRGSVTLKKYLNAIKEGVVRLRLCLFRLTLKVILPLNKSIYTHNLFFIKFHLNHKYILINDKLQYDLELISSKHWDKTEYTCANISNSSRL